MLASKTIWITGASSGIGEACAYQFAREKANLILTASQAERLVEVQQECIRLGAQCKILPFDLSNLEEIDELTDRALASYGTIDIAFLNAGISQRGKMVETDFLVDQKIMNVNFFARVNITKRLVPEMIENGGGTIAITSSISGKFGFPLRSAYASSKFALYGFFETVHAEYYNDNIRVVMVCPGRVHTNISYNALACDGNKHEQLDEGQAKGISSAKAAKKIVRAILAQKPEVLVGGNELLMVYIKRFFPGLARRIVRKIKPN
jgi:short-subunit dehydrogenase